MTKNLTPLLWLEKAYPDKAEEYKQVALKRKRERSKEYQLKLRKAYKKPLKINSMVFLN